MTRTKQIGLTVIELRVLNWIPGDPIGRFDERRNVVILNRENEQVFDAIDTRNIGRLKELASQLSPSSESFVFDSAVK